MIEKKCAQHVFLKEKSKSFTHDSYEVLSQTRVLYYKQVYLCIFKKRKRKIYEINLGKNNREKSSTLKKLFSKFH